MKANTEPRDVISGLATRRIRVAAYAAAVFTVSAVFISLLSGGALWPLAVHLPSILVFCAAGLLFTGEDSSAEDASGWGYERTTFGIASVMTVNILALGVGLQESSIALSLAMVVFAASMMHRNARWYAATCCTVGVAWAMTGVALLEGTIWISQGAAIVFAQLIGGLLWYFNSQEVVRLTKGLSRERDQVETLEKRMQEVRLLLRQKIETSDGLSRQLDELKRIAETDSLTGLASRQFMETFLLSHWQAIRYAYRAVSVLYFDMCDFQRFNNQYGYTAGNTVLMRVAAILKRYATNELQVAARVEGNRFMLVLPGIGAHRASEICEEARAKVRRLTLPEHGVHVPGEIDVSMGMASDRLTSGLKPLDIVGAADAALARAKSTHSPVAASLPNAARTVHDQLSRAAKNVHVLTPLKDAS